MSAHATTYPWPEYSDGGHKLLSDNRDRYIEQSRNTRRGVVAPLPARSRPAATPSTTEAGSGQPIHHSAGVAGKGIEQ